MSLTTTIKKDSNLLLKDFGDPATYKGKSILATYNAPTQVVDMMSGQIGMSKPEALCATADVIGIKHRDPIKVNGTQYYVGGIVDDGYGLTTIELSEDA